MMGGISQMANAMTGQGGGGGSGQPQIQAPPMPTPANLPSNSGQIAQMAPQMMMQNMQGMNQMRPAPNMPQSGVVPGASLGGMNPMQQQQHQQLAMMLAGYYG
jgi:hypothetical protein